MGMGCEMINLCKVLQEGESVALQGVWWRGRGG